MNQIFRNWNRNLSGFDVFSKHTKSLPKLLGIVCQNYRPYSREDEANTKSAKRFSKSIDKLNTCATDLAKDLNGFGMALTPDEFINVFSGCEPYRIANIPDYNQLAMVSELEKIPVSGLDNNLLQKHSLNTETYSGKVNDFKIECAKIVNGLLKHL